MKRDPGELMKACEPEWFKCYLEWLLDRGQIKKQGTLHTAWRFLDWATPESLAKCIRASP